MVVFPPCKINLGLNILSLREDGYHHIETCFYPVPWTDILEIIPAKNETAFTISGLTIPGNKEDNLCLKAFSLLEKDFHIPPIEIFLHKIIPAGAGLGGGSSDAASTLKALNEIFSLGMGNEKLRFYAAQLGSDCAFFVEAIPMLGSGRGEILTSINLSLQGRFLIMITPDIHIGTAKAYQDVTPGKPKTILSEALQLPVTEWRAKVVNDFEATVFQQFPELLKIREKLYSLGADYASMSGSGATVFGLFDWPIDVSKDFPGVQIWSGELPG